jgi:hypothetical protein
MRRQLEHRYAAALALLDGLAARLAEARTGFAALPLDTAAAGGSAEAPPPVVLEPARP